MKKFMPNVVRFLSLCAILITLLVSSSMQSGTPLIFDSAEAEESIIKSCQVPVDIMQGDKKVDEIVILSRANAAAGIYAEFASCKNNIARAIAMDRFNQKIAVMAINDLKGNGFCKDSSGNSREFIIFNNVDKAQGGEIEYNDETYLYLQKSNNFAKVLLHDIYPQDKYQFKTSREFISCSNITADNRLFDATKYLEKIQKIPKTKQESEIGIEVR